MPPRLFCENQLLNILRNNLHLNETLIDEIFNGAFVVVKHDNGKFYEKLVNSNLAAYERLSSHPSLSSKNSRSIIINGRCIGRSQMAIDTMYFRTLLFGKIRCPDNIKKHGDPQLYYREINGKIMSYEPPNNMKICTWFQFESSRWNSPNQTIYDTVCHSIEFIKYVINGKNYGPLGTSKYTGRPMTWNPLLVSFNRHKSKTVKNATPNSV